MSPADNPGPLSHVKVLDLCQARAGPTAVRVLADLGAQVIQVTRPGESALDASFPNFDRENLHRNKRSMFIDLQTDPGRQLFYRMVKDADVVVENFRAAVKYRLKIDYDTLKQINPRIVMGSISGFGQDGPYGDRPGVDQIAQGMGGLMSITGPPGGGPWRVGIAISDLCSGMFLAHGIMAALIERESSGQGQWVHTSLLEAQIAMLDFQATRWLIGHDVPPQAGNDHPTGFPTGVFPASDGVVNIAATGDRQWRAFLQVIQAEELDQDDRFNTARGRGVNRAELRSIVEEKTRRFTMEQLIQAMNDAGVPCGPILTIDQVFANPQVQHLGMAQTVQSPRYGELDLVRAPMRLSRTSTSLRRPAPAPGEHTAEVLREYGYSEDDIRQLEDTAVIAPKKKVAT
ncbi:MAG: CoA transferase [Chloroflexi bacterium]|nr:CoA transferase [Chloroflexota bacterium]MBV9132195.1 CoA transferase [Chloroflexota bacterium]MBV9893114.1 CoA transferase [Chloroflexota bacterium]